MIRSWTPDPSKATAGTFLRDLISYYREGTGEGQLRVCRQADLTHRAQQFLDREAPLSFHLSDEMAPALGGCSQGDLSPAQDVCPELVWALEFLELISVHLLLFPWRKEIRSLKTYTGSFVYSIQPVLSKQALDAILGRLGYTATSEVEFSLVRTISEEDTKQMVLEIFLARVTCEAIVGTLGRQVCGLSRERLTRCSPQRGLGKVHNRFKGTQPGPGLGELQQGFLEGAKSERALAENTEGQFSLPMLLSLPEISTAPTNPINSPLVPLEHQGRASTCSDSEEFLTQYSDLALHRTPLFPRVPPAAHSQVCRVPDHHSPAAELKPVTSGTDTCLPSTSCENDELCECLSHLLGPIADLAVFLSLGLKRKDTQSQPVRVQPRQ